MGTPVPPEWPDFEGFKYYLVTVDSYYDAGPAGDCTQDFVYRARCCKETSVVVSWLGLGYECLSPYELCYVVGYTAQRVVALLGPYDTLGECVADL